MIGAAAIQGLHAQAKPPAYQVIEVDVKDPDLYREYQAKAMPLQLQYSARFIARGGKVETFAGDPPKRGVIAVYDNIEKVEAPQIQTSRVSSLKILCTGGSRGKPP